MSHQPRRPSSARIGSAAVFAMAAFFLLPAGRAGAAGGEDPREVRAREDFAVGRYQEALELYGKLYVETMHPTYLRNIGRCHQFMGQPDKAINSFREHLRRATDLTATQRAEVEGFIREMEDLKRRQATEAPPTPASSTTPPPTGDRGGLRLAGWIAGGVGLAALATGAYFGTRVQALNGELDDLEHAQGNIEGRGYTTKLEDAKRASTRQWIFYGVGAGALAAGAVCLVLGRAQGGGSESTLAAWADLAPGQALAGLGGRF
jgi:tetratricopeptide (TPR) repeat protein